MDPTLLQSLEQFRVSDHSVLDDFCHSSSEFPHRQGVQRQWINHHQSWLMEGSDQILSLRMVDTGLAADGGIHHGQKSCRNLDNADTAQPACRREAGHVADNTTTERQHEGGALQALLLRLVQNQAQRVQVFSFFTRIDFQQHRFESSSFESFQAALAVGPGHVGIAHHKNFGP